jgi:hypothetical protein
MLHGLKLAGLEDATASWHAPCDACELVGERDGKHVGMQSPLRSCNPLLEPVTLPDLRLDQDDPSA